jgi:hypothetical protein
MCFALQVPGRGLVAGVLLYYPFVNEAETLPLEASSAHHVAVITYNLTQARRPARASTARQRAASGGPGRARQCELHVKVGLT